MAKQRRAKRVSSARARRDRDDAQNTPERAAESLTEMAAASGAQAVRFAAAVARGMARGIAGAARELRAPAREVAESVTETARSLSDSATRGVERATTTRRGTRSSKRRSA
jgi:hypothetical protein